MNSTCLGMSTWLRFAMRGLNLNPFVDYLLKKSQLNEQDHDAVFDLSLLAQLLGNSQWGLVLEDAVLKDKQLFYPIDAQSDYPSLTLLAICSAGGVHNNTQIECLLNGTNINLGLLMMGQGIAMSTELPEHELVFTAVSPNEHTRPLLASLVSWLESGDSRPVINKPSRLLTFLDTPTQTLLAGISGVVYSCASNISANELAMEDGMIPHYRVILVDGRPYVYQIAIGSSLTDYATAKQSFANDTYQALEEQYIHSFNSLISSPFDAQWQAIYQALGLDYVGIDCTRTNDGQLLITQIDPSMLVQNYDLRGNVFEKVRAFEALQKAVKLMLLSKQRPS